MGKYKKLGKNTIIFTIGTFGQKILSFIFVPFYTYFLTTEEYGTADLVSTTANLLFPIFTIIIGEAMMRFALDKCEDNKQVFSIGMSTWMKGSVIFLIASPLILLYPSLKAYYLFVVLYYIAHSLYSTLSYFVKGLEKNLIFAISGIIYTGVAVGLNILLLCIFGLGVEGYLISYIAANFISSIFLVVAAQLFRYIDKSGKRDKELRGKMLHYSLPMIPNSISWWISNSSDKYILTAIAGVSITGIYSAAYKIPSVISIISNIFISAWRVSVVDEFNTSGSRKFYSEIFDAYITVTLIGTSVLLVLNKFLASILFSKDFYQAWQFVPILLLASVLLSYSDFFGTIYTASYKTKGLFSSTLLGAVINIVMNCILIPLYGAMGAAIATLSSYFVICIFRIIHSRRIQRIDYNIGGNLISFVLIIIQVVVASISIKHEVLISIAILLAVLVTRYRSIKFLVEKYITYIRNRRK